MNRGSQATFKLLGDLLDKRDALWRCAINLKPIGPYTQAVGDKPDAMVRRHQEEHKKYLLDEVEKVDEVLDDAMVTVYAMLEIDHPDLARRVDALERHL